MAAKRIALITIVGLLASALVLAPTAPAAACGAEVIVLKTFHITIKADKKVYAIGDVAKVLVTVTRPAHEDPADLGIEYEPPHSEPAEDVNVGVGLRVGDVFLFGHGVTDAKGEAKVGIPIPSYAPTGRADASAFAWKERASVPCARVEENGYTEVLGLFRIIPR